MPSRQRQQGFIITDTRDKDERKYILVSKKTGFQNVWIGNRHFYYNYYRSYGSPSEVNFNSIVNDAPQNNRRRKSIVIRRKRYGT